MRLLRTVGELREVLAPERRAGRSIGLVPTMGALHDGHLSLIAAARAECDVVVVSLFVNPAQFNESADLERYPRDERRDAVLAEQAGADLMFAPPVEEVYPQGFATAVEVLGGVSERLEGAHRGAEHFRGVATVVTKLLCMSQPDRAYFGRKDAQQVAVIERLVADLDLPVAVRALPTVRDHDGLALSSRNALLSPVDRRRALALPAALRAASALAQRGERSAPALLAAARAELDAAGLEPEYLALVEPDSMEPVQTLDGPALLALAARVGGVRLIDNVVLQAAATGGGEAAGTGKAVAACSA